MEICELAVPDAFRITPRALTDDRGLFYEAVRGDLMSDALGHPFRVAQSNYSVSRRGTLRGIHGVSAPPGQAKLVTCVRGAALDVVVDMRVGSPTFGRWDQTLLSPDTGVSVYIGEGIGHAFLALRDDTCINYLCSTEYVARTTIEVHPLDPALGLPWDLDALDGPPVLSAKDAAAPTLAEAAAAGLLSGWETCRTLHTEPGPSAARTPVPSLRAS